LPELTASYAGFVQRRTTASLDVGNAGHVGHAASLAGSYAITVSGASDADYAIATPRGS